mgnify:CR=1 FL=1
MWHDMSAAVPHSAWLDTKKLTPTRRHSVVAGQQLDLHGGGRARPAGAAAAACTPRKRRARPRRPRAVRRCMPVGAVEQRRPAVLVRRAARRERDLLQQRARLVERDVAHDPRLWHRPLALHGPRLRLVRLGNLARGVADPVEMPLCRVPRDGRVVVAAPLEHRVSEARVLGIVGVPIDADSIEQRAGGQMNERN